MPFPKKQIPIYPRRYWELVSRAGAGKSTFLTQMRSPLLPIDADHRIDEVAYLNPNMLELSAVASDHNNPSRIAEILNQNMPGAQVGTIAVDSLTAIIAPLVTKAMNDKDEGKSKNLYAGFKAKAQAMRTLQDAVTKWGCDVLWIYHTEERRDADGNLHTRDTISKTEIAGLMRSINLRLEIVIDDKTQKRGIKVRWARRGRSGMTLWDDTGKWLGMPEKIEAAVYDGLSVAEQDAIEKTLPQSFPDDASAIAWGLEQGAFTALAHARNAYEKLVRDHDGDNLEGEDKSALWIADVAARKESLNVTNSTEFWARVRALQYDDTAAKQSLSAHTTNGKTDYAAAYRDIYGKSGARR